MKTYIEETEYMSNLLEFIGSDKMNDMIKSTIGANDNMYKQGVMFGLAIAPYAMIKCKKYNSIDAEDFKDVFVDFTPEQVEQYRKAIEKAYPIDTGVSIFDDMRDATEEEQKSVTDYIHNIATDTGIKFDNIK